ncbi:hypothetical protein Cal7507_6138 [Calothrix sp. PCC 7507]|nr:hypothetical protein Cal7507_6138 [Calothrix sp. PCC 7507]
MAGKIDSLQYSGNSEAEKDKITFLFSLFLTLARNFIDIEEIAMTAETNQATTGADAIDEAIASGIDFDGSPIPSAKLELYTKVMALEANRQRSGVSNTMRSRIVRIGAKHIPQGELDQLLVGAGFAPLKEKEIAFFYGGK